MTKIELGNKLREMYENAIGVNQVAMIHLFGILYATEIEKAGATNAEIIKAAQIRPSYHAELSKGRKLARFVSVKPEYLVQFKD